MSRNSRVAFASCLLGFLFCCATPLTAAAHPNENDQGQDGNGRGRDRIRVDRITFPVTLSDGHPYQIAGFLYHDGPLNQKQIQIVVHGGTYDHKYWDIDELNGERYSYARYMAARGHAVLAIDQMGTGESSRPDGDWLTLDDTARALHQVVASVRSNHNPTGRKFRQVALVGHSNGSLTSVYESGTYNDADALVTTAWLHSPHPLPFDPAAILSVLTTPYIPAGTFPEPFIAATFYHLPKTDPAMIHYDYTHLQADQSRRQFLDLLGAALNPAASRSTSVQLPVLDQLGDFDTLAPSGYGAGEASFYPNARSFTVQQLTDIGHDVNAHVNHLQSWIGIERWLERTLGSCRDD